MPPTDSGDAPAAAPVAASAADARRALLPIFLIVLVDVLGLTIILPLLPFYAEHFGASPTVCGLLITSYAACQLVSGPLLGRASDRTGRKPLLLVSQLGTFLGFLLLAFSTRLWMVFLARVLDGATAGNLSLAQAYIADVTAPKDRARSFALIGIAFGFGFLVGPAVSGYLGRYGYEWPILLAAALSLTSILCTALLLPSGKPPGATPVVPPRDGQEGPPPPAGRRLSVLDWGAYVDFFRRPRLGNLLGQFFLFFLSFSTFNAGFALFGERRFVWHGRPFGVEQVGYVLAYAGFLGIILQGGFVGRLVKRFGESRLANAGYASLVVGYVLLALAHSVPMLLAAATVAAFGNGVIRPSLTSLITQSVGRNEQGAVLGLNQSLQSVGSIVAPVVAGALIDRGLLGAWAGMAAAIALGGLVVGLVRHGSSPPAAAPSSTGAAR